MKFDLKFAEFRRTIFSKLPKNRASPGYPRWWQKQTILKKIDLFPTALIRKFYACKAAFLGWGMLQAIRSGSKIVVGPLAGPVHFTAERVLLMSAILKPILLICAFLTVVGVWFTRFDYRCPVCSAVYHPSFLSSFFSFQWMGKKYLRCPHCRQRTWSELRAPE